MVEEAFVFLMGDGELDRGRWVLVLPAWSVWPWTYS